jgi:hypothetical protein
MTKAGETRRKTRRKQCELFLKKGTTKPRPNKLNYHINENGH